MSEFFDEEGPSEPPPPEPVKELPVMPEKLEVDIRGLGGALLSMVGDQVAEQVNRVLNGEANLLRKVVAAEVQRIVSGELEARVRGEVEDVLRNGWKKTDDWGRELKSVTIRDMAIDYVNGKDGSYDRDMRLSKIMKETLEQAIRGELGKEIAAAKEAFKQMLDESLRAKLAEALRVALGLGTG